MNTNAHDSHDKTVFGALLMGILCTMCIYTYSTNNLDLLGLSPDTQKARTLENIVLLLGQTFLSFIIGRIYLTNKAWAYKLGFILLILFIVDFSTSYQARNAINQIQTLTKSATEEHAKLIVSQIGVSQNAAKELTDSAQRQRDNKMITGSANTAQKAAKQSDNAVELIKLHGETIKQIKPTEADTFGAWTGNVVFFAMLGLYLLNDAMWAFIGHFIGGGLTPARDDSVTPARDDSVTPARDDSVTPAPVKAALDVESARAEVRAKAAQELARELDRMPILPKMPLKQAVPVSAIVPLVTPVPVPTPPELPQLPAITNYSFDVVRSVDDSEVPEAPKAPRKRAAKPAGMQMDTGTTGKASHRYKRVKSLVESRKTNPSVRQLMALEGEQINADRAREYLDAMIRDGVLIKVGDRWKYAPAIDPRQIELGGV